MLLLALQTTISAADDSTIDTVTLVLVVIFIASMIAFTVVMRRDDAVSDTDRATPAPPPAPATTQIPVTPSPRPEREPLSSNPARPAWLEGVAFPTAVASLADAAAIIEGLLSARREKDLRRGLEFYTPESLQSLRESMGFDDDQLARAEFTGEPPILRSVEVVSASGNTMTVRAGYATGSSETFRLVQFDGRWMIEEMFPGR